MTVALTASKIGPDFLAVMNLPIGVQPGTVLAGKYRIERILGAGGMGVVVAAHHLHLDERVALKFLLPEAIQSSDAVSRFVREARAAAKIKNEHVARVSDVGQLENGAPFMVMEYLEGSDLAACLQQRGPLPVQVAVDFVLQASEAIADAHVLGIVHRDLKPSNLFCTQRSDGQPFIKVLDFGISKVTQPGTPGHDMTRTATVMGSPLYMSPEQMVMSKGVDARADIWSLGVILFELLTARPPFTADAITELAIKVANEPPPALRSLRIDAPPGLESVIARCLHKDRAQRFQTIGQLASALGEFASRGAQGSVERILGALRKAGGGGEALASPGETQRFETPAVSGSVPSTAASWGRTPRAQEPARGPRLLAVALVSSVALLIALGGVLSLRGRLWHRAPVSATQNAPSAETEPAPSTSVVPAPSAAASVGPSADLASVAQTASAPSAPSGASAPQVPSSTPPPNRARPPAPAPTTPPKVNCDPPYVINEKGTRVFKKECL